MSNDTETPVPHDDGLEWLRAIRREISAEANHDPAEMIRRLREREREMPERMFKTRRVLVPAGAPDEV